MKGLKAFKRIFKRYKFKPPTVGDRIDWPLYLNIPRGSEAKYFEKLLEASGVKVKGGFFSCYITIRWRDGYFDKEISFLPYAERQE